MKKECPICKKTKKSKHFYLRSNGYLYSYCKVCLKARAANAYYEKNPIPGNAVKFLKRQNELKFKAVAKVGGRPVCLGRFETKSDARRALFEFRQQR